MTSTPDGPVGAAARNPIVMPLRTSSRTDMSIIYSTTFLSECKVKTQTEVQSKIVQRYKLWIKFCLKMVNCNEEIYAGRVHIEQNTYR